MRSSLYVAQRRRDALGKALVGIGLRDFAPGAVEVPVTLAVYGLIESLSRFFDLVHAAEGDAHAAVSFAMRTSPSP